MTIPVKAPTAVEKIDQALIKGDLANLTVEEKLSHYKQTCDSLGLNPYTRPFDYIVLNGKEQLYPNRSCADQLRKLHSVSLEIVSRDIANEILTIHVRARLPDGRTDEDLGTVPLTYPDRVKTRDGWRDHPKKGQRLVGDDLANAELKAITKAKRRTTFSICGLGWLDETEVETIPGARRPPEPAPNVMQIGPAAGRPATEMHDPQTGEIIESAAPTADAAPAKAPIPEQPPTAGAATDSQRIHALDEGLAKAARGGMDALREAWDDLAAADKKTLRAALDRRHKPTAVQADSDREQDEQRKADAALGDPPAC